MIKLDKPSYDDDDSKALIENASEESD